MGKKIWLVLQQVCCYCFCFNHYVSKVKGCLLSQSSLLFRNPHLLFWLHLNYVLLFPRKPEIPRILYVYRIFNLSQLRFKSLPCSVVFLKTLFLVWKSFSWLPLQYKLTVFFYHLVMFYKTQIHPYSSAYPVQCHWPILTAIERQVG